MTLEEFKEAQKEYFLSEKGAMPAIVQEIYEDEDGEEYISEDWRCVYRTEDGRGCAVGFAIPKEMYVQNKHIDSAGGIAANQLPPEIREHLGINNETEQFFMAVQQIHDDVALSGMIEENDHFGEAFLARVEEVKKVAPELFTEPGMRLIETQMSFRYNR